MDFDNFHGMNVVIYKGGKPKMQLSEDVMVSDEMRAKTNAWMRDFFGVVPTILDGEVMFISGKLCMNSNTYNAIKVKYATANSRSPSR